MTTIYSLSFPFSFLFLSLFSSFSWSSLPFSLSKRQERERERVRRKKEEEEGKRRKGKRVYCCRLPLLPFFYFLFSLLSFLFFPLFALFNLADATGMMSYVVFKHSEAVSQNGSARLAFRWGLCLDYSSSCMLVLFTLSCNSKRIRQAFWRESAYRVALTICFFFRCVE